MLGPGGGTGRWGAAARHERLSDLNELQWRRNVDYTIDRHEDEHAEIWHALEASTKASNARLDKLLAIASGLLISVATASIVLAITIASGK